MSTFGGIGIQTSDLRRPSPISPVTSPSSVVQKRRVCAEYGELMTGFVMVYPTDRLAT